VARTKHLEVREEVADANGVDVQGLEHLGNADGREVHGLLPGDGLNVRRSEPPALDGK
jgi:hypothetical protein